jgi:hypothetical protein
MSFTGREDHSIPLATAVQWTANYRAASPQGSVKGHFFGKDAIKSILDQANCVGIRIYYALDDNGVKHLIVVGVKADESDIYTGLLAERSMPCPPYCGNGGGTSPLQG